MNAQIEPPVPHIHPHRLHPGMLVFGLFCLLLPAAFIWLHLTAPSDGARLARSAQNFTDHGVVVSPYAVGSSLLREDDIVIAVDGTPLEALSLGLIDPRSGRWGRQTGQFVAYTVLREGEAIDLEIPLGPLPLGAILRDHWSLIFFLFATQALTLFVYSQNPQDPAARAFFVWAFSGSHTYTWSFYLQISDLLNPVRFWLFHLAATGLWLIFWAAMVHVTLVFPKPLIPLNRLRPWLILLYLSPVLFFAAYLVVQWFDSSSLLAWWDRWGTAQILVAALYSLPALVMIVFQYATSRSEIERLKTRWVIFGGTISLSFGLVFYFIPSLLGKSSITPNALGLINFPFIITLAIAIWRYRLFDIDLIIRKTLQYSLLTGLLSLVYFAGVALLQGLLTADRGRLTASDAAAGNQPSAVVIVVTTLAIAALFNPLRRRIQDFIDRRFYRQKYDAEKALAEFAASARSETDLTQLSARLTGTVQETLQPASTGLWLIRLRKDKE